MEFEGVVYKILPVVEGSTARGSWKKQEVVFEIPSEYSRKVCVTFFNKISDVERLKEGETYIVSINIESREYNGRWYTDVRAWRVQPKQPVAPTPAAPMTDDMPPLGEEPSYISSADSIDDMPF